MKSLPPIEFVLTPCERSIAAYGTVHLEKMRRTLNERDAQWQSMGRREDEAKAPDDQRTSHEVFL